jgi:small-conductance mechanosensitive channel
LRVQLLTRRSDQAALYASAAEERVELASELLPKTVSDEDLAQLQKDVDEADVAVEQAAAELRTAEISASHLSVDTPEGRSQERLVRQKLTEASVVSALAEVQAAKSRTLLIWAELLVGKAPDVKVLQEGSLFASALVRRVKDNALAWLADTQDELFAVQTADRDGLSRSARRLLDQRSGTAQATLSRIDELEAAAEDLGLLTAVAEDVFVENVGTFKSWLAVTNRFFRGFSQRLGEIADTTLFSVGETPVAGSDILRFIIILLVAYLLSRVVRHAIDRASRSQETGTQASLYTVGRLTHYTIITIAIFVALTTIGLDFSNLALVAGALSVGIGFGLQSIVGNFVSGLIILFEHSLRVGDYIELDTGLTGTVKAINVRSTLINTNDNIDIVVPNSEFVSARLTNWTLGERILRVRIPFGVAYGSDKELVRKAGLEAAAEVQYTLKNLRGREPDVWLVEYGDSSLNFLLLVWVNRQGARRPTRTRAAYLWALEDKFREYGIEIPFPQRDLNLRTGWPGSQQETAEPEALEEDKEPDEQD